MADTTSQHDRALSEISTTMVAIESGQIGALQRSTGNPEPVTPVTLQQPPQEE